MSRFDPGDEPRRRRKVEHMEAVESLGDLTVPITFRDVHLLPNCAPDMDWGDVSLATELCGLPLSSPIIINAMTGGAPEAGEVNRRLAGLARRHGLAMALGSEKAALRDPSVASTYSIARTTHPDGVLLANIGMGASPKDARAAIDLIAAQCLQIHWNVGQELFMAEGDRHFRGAGEAFQAVVHEVAVPVIAKEVGLGIAAPEVEQFIAWGARGIDVGGRGGTNFLAVEAWRRGQRLSSDWGEFGIPTVAALIEAREVARERIDVVASGGIRTGHDIAKAMALGANAVGIAGPILRLLRGSSDDTKADHLIAELHWTLSALLLLTGSRTWEELRRRPRTLTGGLWEWLRGRQAGP